MARLFRRRVEVLIAKADETSFFQAGPNAARITDLRVAFAIEKQLSTDPNTCDIEISNLSEETRAAIQQKPLKIFLSAGYDDDLKQIFVGDLRWAESMRLQTGWTTKIQVGDGERAFKNARTNRSFAGGVQYNQVLKEITDSMGLSIPQNVAEARELTANLINGEAISGPSHKELTRILAARGFSWSVQDGQLQILREGEVRQNVALVINAENGMVGSPGYGSPPKKGEPPTLTVENLLYPEIIPGIKLDITSLGATGLFRAVKVSHAGDTHGEAWSTTVEATPL